MKCFCIYKSCCFCHFFLNFPKLATCTNFHCSDSEFLIRICRAWLRLCVSNISRGAPSSSLEDLSLIQLNNLETNRSQACDGHSLARTPARRFALSPTRGGPGIGCSSPVATSHLQSRSSHIVQPRPCPRTATAPAPSRRVPSLG
jgi:hypothetical protein